MDSQTKELRGATINVFTVMLVIFTSLAGFAIATQWTAKMLAYQKQLGDPLFRLFHYPIYNPFSGLVWMMKYYNYAPKQFDLGLVAFLVSGVGPISIALIMMRFRDRGRKELSSHGTARWATTEEVAKSGLVEGQGVVFGLAGPFKDKYPWKYLRHDGPEHMIAMAPTRSGKGVGIIVPTLLAWQGSVLVTDIKGENYGITAGFRQKVMKNIILKFDPTNGDGSSVKFNPLEEIRLGTKHEVQDTQNIVNILVDPQGTGQLDHWGKTGSALLVGAILHVLYHEENKTLRGVAAFLSRPDIPGAAENPDEEVKTGIVKALEEIKSTDHLENAATNPRLKNIVKEYEAEGRSITHLFTDIYGTSENIGTHPIAAEAAQELLNKSENERSGVLSTAMSFLGLYRDPIIAENTSQSEFSINDLMHHDQPVSLYMIIPPSEIGRVIPLIRMIINLVICKLTEKMKFKGGQQVTEYKHRLLLMIDEFPAFGRIDTFEKALAFIAGYGLKAFLIVQSIKQLKKAYTRENSILDNCHIRIVYTPNDEETPELITKLLGDKTEITQSMSYSGNRLGMFLKNVSYSTSETKRALLTPGEVSTFPADEEIVFIAGTPPIRAKKIRYYEDPTFMNRVQEAPPKTDKIKDPKAEAAAQKAKAEAEAKRQAQATKSKEQLIEDLTLILKEAAAAFLAARGGVLSPEENTTIIGKELSKLEQGGVPEIPTPETPEPPAPVESPAVCNLPLSPPEENHAGRIEEAEAVTESEGPEETEPVAPAAGIPPEAEPEPEAEQEQKEPGEHSGRSFGF